MSAGESIVQFPETKVSDSKKLVRAEHLLFARNLLRARRNSHCTSAKIAILAGGHPQGEIETVKSLFKSARIHAFDLDPTCVEKAVAAGAEGGNTCDLLDCSHVPRKGFFPPPAVVQSGPFDIFVLDLCAIVTNRMVAALRAYVKHAITRDGVVICTFAYGRDVAEHALAVYEARRGESYVRKMVFEGVPEKVAGRIADLRGDKATPALRSVALYPGNKMPMCSTVWTNESQFTPEILPSILRVGQDDLEKAIRLHEDAVDPYLLYATPQERIAAARKHAVGSPQGYRKPKTVALVRQETSWAKAKREKNEIRIRLGLRPIQ